MTVGNSLNESLREACCSTTSAVIIYRKNNNPAALQFVLSVTPLPWRVPGCACLAGKTLLSVTSGVMTSCGAMPAARGCVTVTIRTILTACKAAFRSAGGSNGAGVSSDIPDSESVFSIPTSHNRPDVSF